MLILGTRHQRGELHVKGHSVTIGEFLLRVESPKLEKKATAKGHVFQDINVNCMFSDRYDMYIYVYNVNPTANLL